MAKEQTGDELNLRRKARRRLIGAVALTLAVVVILPMVLDSEPKPTGQDIDLRIPAPDKVGEFVPGVAASEVVEALPLAASAVEAGTAPLAASAVASSVPGVVRVDTAKPPVIAAAPVSASGKEPAAAAVPKAETPGKAQPAASKPAESRKPEPKAAEAKAVETKSADKHAAAESYVAQVGAYANADTAKQEADKLKKWGFKAYTEKVGDKVRVRVGPYAERDKAEKVRHLLEKHGLHPVIATVK